MPTSITIIGNLVEDPQVRNTNSGLQIVEARIASNEGKDKTTWWTAKFFGNKAGEILAEYGKKGSSVVVIGSTEEESWEKDGQKRSKVVCIASSFSFLNTGSKPESDAKADEAPSARQTSTRAPARTTTRTNSRPSAPVADDDDIPF